MKWFHLLNITLPLYITAEGLVQTNLKTFVKNFLNLCQDSTLKFRTSSLRTRCCISPKANLSGHCAHGSPPLICYPKKGEWSPPSTSTVSWRSRLARCKKTKNRQEDEKKGSTVWVLEQALVGLLFFLVFTLTSEVLTVSVSILIMRLNLKQLSLLWLSLLGLSNTTISCSYGQSKLSYQT